MSKPGAVPAYDGVARTRERSRRPFRRIAAILTSLALGAGLALVGVAAPASAHHNTITAKATCDVATGTFDITWSVENSETRTEKITKSSNTALVPVGTTLDKREVKTFVQSGVAAGTYKLALSAKWSNGATDDNSGSITLDEAMCGSGQPVKKIEFCHATGSASNPYVTIETSVMAFFKAGHIDHQDHRDIYPAFSYLDNKGKLIKVAAQGDQSLLAYEGCVKPIVKIEVEGAPSFSDTCGPDNEVFILPADTEKIDWNSVEKNGVITVTATAKPGFEFVKGSKTEWTFTIDDSPCVVPVEGAPSFSDTCGPDNEQLSVPADTEKIDWNAAEKDGVITVTATAKPGFVFPAGAKTEWTFPIDDAPCVIEVVGAPSFSDTCGPDNEQLTVPEDTATIDWNSTEVDGVITVTATAKPGNVFPAGATTSWTYSVDDKPCIVEVVGAPTFHDTCGPDNEQLTVPEDTATIDWSSTEVGGVITVTATAKAGSAFPEGATTTWTFTIDDSPCKIELVGAPTFSDTCGPENEKLVVPADTDTIDWESVRADGVITVTATAKPGYAFEQGGPVKWTFPYSDADCIAPSLKANVLTGTCEADSPWIFFDVELIDPDKQSTGNTASIVLTDGKNTETIKLGDLVDGKLDGKVLWPGASVDADGKANGWPGWAFFQGQWIEVDDNFAWTRGPITATLVVNPQLDVPISYPKATPACAMGPKITPGGKGGVPAAASESGLASTGFAGTPIAIAAGIIVIAGLAFVVVARIRRKRA